MSYRQQIHIDYEQLFSNADNGGEELTNETEEERIKRLAEEKESSEANEFWNWYNYIYSLAKGDLVQVEKVLEVNFRLSITHKLFELRHKKTTEWYDFRRYNLTARA